jgi:deoxyribonuclease IV
MDAFVGKKKVEIEKGTGAANKFVGAHLSIVGGLESIYARNKEVKGRAIGLFLMNQRTFSPKIAGAEEAKRFIEATPRGMRKYLLPHASYLINLANPDKAKGAMSTKRLLDEVRACEILDIPGCNLHPGSNVGKLPIEEACSLVSTRINKVLGKTRGVAVILENMAGQGSVLGARFEELKMIIDGVEDKKRVGVCLDTCHLFGAGYDIRTEQGFECVMRKFEKTVGMGYLRGVHLNDSKEPLGSKRDRHESIGKGHIGLEAFRYLMNNRRFDGIPMILETPDPSKYPEEVALLYSLGSGSCMDQEEGGQK